MNVANPVNASQAEAWDGDEGAHWVLHQEWYESLVSGFTPRLLDAARIGRGDRVLDLGCGCGQTTRLAARRAPDGFAVGIDLSRVMLERAREDAWDESLPNVSFGHGDAQVHPFSAASFDVALSRFGVMFFDDPRAAFTNIGRALVPGGRLAFLCWQDLLVNEWLAVPAGAALAHVPVPELGGEGEPGPFSLSDPDRVTAVLTAAGFQDISIEAVDAAMRLGDDADDAVGFLRGTGLARTLLDQVDTATADAALGAVADALRAHESDDGVNLHGAAWLVVARSATTGG